MVGPRTSHITTDSPYFWTEISYFFSQNKKFTVHDVIQGWIRVSGHDNLHMSRKERRHLGRVTLYESIATITT